MKTVNDMNTVEKYLKKQQLNKQVSSGRAVAVLAFALVLIICVFWWLKLIGITMAGEALCGMQEHVHSEQCTEASLGCQIDHDHTDECYETYYTCRKQAHIHVASCYADLEADIETKADWTATLSSVEYGDSSLINLINVARSQIGYTESSANFKVDASGVRYGYTRYGEWYGNPYGSWSTMFTSFCLRYAGIYGVPISAGAETMRLKWVENGIYQSADRYTPLAGDILFLDKNGNGSADATAVITAFGDGTLSVIEGDYNGTVAESLYSLSDAAIQGYGLVQPASSLIVMRNTFALRALDANGNEIIAKTVDYDQSLFIDINSFVVYTVSGSQYYAFDGNGNAVPISIDNEGNITSQVADPDTLLWSFTYSSQNSYLIRNVSTGRYMHAYPNNGSGVTTSGAYPSTLIESGQGVKIRSNSEYARLNAQNGVFEMTQSATAAAVYQFGVTSRCTVWLDGTCGGLMNLGGSLDKSYSLVGGDVITLPSEWQSPEKYRYRLQGWYDVKNAVYYKPGEEVTVTENMVFYADWVAETYDFGVFNSQTVVTESTSNFITTKVFDFGPLFNMLSTRPTVQIDSSGHTENWSMVANGNVPYQNGQSLDFIFVDYDGNGDISYPTDRDAINTSGGITSGIYSDYLGNILFSDTNSFDPATKSGILGKTYLGMGDYLFQYSDDPDSEYYGYYYYNSSMNAASYNRSEQRFYVYEYLERTRDASKTSGVNSYSDFLPLNSPYANTNNKDLVTYTYDGVNGEYANINHYQYDSKYNTDGNSTNNVITNYWFGMSIELRFYLPDVPGSKDALGAYGNKDLYGNDMLYEFAGDDDLWVLLDGELVLDLGGIHGSQDGEINFSTGDITVNGTTVGNLHDVAEGDHVMTVYYLERGSSQSNCEMHFNVVPRFALDIRKEDVLTQEALDGAQFSVYTDPDCTIPAILWNSEDEYILNRASTNVFTVTDGTASMWGLSPGETYYIKETKAPDAEGYGCADGIICLFLDKRGIASYTVEILRETDGDGNWVEVSQGFTVYGFTINEDTHNAYITVTNAADWVQETTTVQTFKTWEDDKDHTDDHVTVYLTVTDPDGTVRRIRQIVLGEENDWSYVWTNLPKYLADMTTPVRYGVEEAYHSGYYSTVTQVQEITVTTTTWGEALTFQNNGVYVLKTSNGCLATASATDGKLVWVDEESAKVSPLALWTVTISGSNMKFTNGAGFILTFNYSSSSSSRYFYATKSGATYQTLMAADAGSGIRLYCRRNNSSYYMLSLTSSTGRISYTATASRGLVFVPMTKFVDTETQKVDGLAFKLTNIPLEIETSLTVRKEWDMGNASSSVYEQSLVTVRLLANGKDTGRTVTLSLKNGWTDTFQGLPYTDDDGNVISYSIEESWLNEDFNPLYGEVVAIYNNGEAPTYETTLTNVYRYGRGVLLPTTGGLGQTPWILCGATLMLASLAMGALLVLRRRRTDD